MLQMVYAVIILVSMIIMLDVDGVMTDGTKTYDRYNNVVSKTFCDRDFTAIKQFQAGGHFVQLISGDPWNKSMAKARRIPFICTRSRSGTLTSKAEHCDRLRQEHGTEVVAIGDDIFDLDMLENADYSFCPASAHPQVKAAFRDWTDEGADWAVILAPNSGTGYVASMFDELARHQVIEVPSIESVVALDSKQY